MLDTPTASGVRALERYCEDMARREAANFYWGFIALPAASARPSMRSTTSRARSTMTPTSTVVRLATSVLSAIAVAFAKPAPATAPTR